MMLVSMGCHVVGGVFVVVVVDDGVVVDELLWLMLLLLFFSAGTSAPRDAPGQQQVAELRLAEPARGTLRLAANGERAGWATGVECLEFVPQRSASLSTVV